MSGTSANSGSRSYPAMTSSPAASTARISSRRSAPLGHGPARGSAAHSLHGRWIDNFNTINEIYGFDVGDQIFAALAKCSRAAPRRDSRPLLRRQARHRPHRLRRARHAGGRRPLPHRGQGTKSSTDAVRRGYDLDRRGIAAATRPDSKEAMAHAQEALHLARRRGTANSSPTPIRRRARRSAERMRRCRASSSPRSMNPALPRLPADRRYPHPRDALLRGAAPGRALRELAGRSNSRCRREARSDPVDRPSRTRTGPRGRGRDARRPYR